MPHDPSRRVVLDRQRLTGAEFPVRALDYFCAIASRFDRCSWRNAVIESVTWGAGKRQSLYVECCFDGATLGSVLAGNARFVRCSFRDVRIAELWGDDVELVDCVFSGCIDKGFLNGARDPLGTRLGIFERTFGRKRNEIAGNDFSECDLVDFDFRSGIDLKRQRLPCGPEYLYLPDTAAAIRTGRAAIDRWAADETRRLAIILLDMMADDLKMGQAQKLVRVPIRGAFAEPWRRLREALVD